MAANKVVDRRGHGDLAADTIYKFNVTGSSGRGVELVHHGKTAAGVDVAIACYAIVGNTEAAVDAFALTVAKDEAEVILPHERLLLEIPRAGLWIAVRCLEAVRVSAVASRG